MILHEEVDMRRPKGEGMAPRWRPWDRRWEARFVDASGRRRSVFVTTPGRAGERECERLLGDRLREAQAGIRPSELTLGAYLERWVARNVRLAPKSRERYGYVVRVHVAPSTQGRIPVIRLQPEDLEDLYAERLAAGCAPKSVELIHTVVRGALATAAQRGHVLRNVGTMVSPPPVPRRKRDVFSLPEVERMLAVGDRLTALWTLAYQVPIREGELLGLRWSEIDLDAARLVLRDPEKDGVPRTLILPRATVRALRSHKVRQAEQRLLTGGAYDGELVFANDHGERLDPRRVRDQFARVLRAAGVPLRRVHDLRHTGITHLLEAGVPLKVVQEIAGHRSARTTIETYAHATETMQAQAVAAMDRALG